jgi:hypothetical protein
MAIFLPSAHALKRVVAELGPELAPILRLEMAAWDVQATRGKHATHKPVTLRCTAAFRHSAYALKRVVAGLGSELAPILSLEMAAGDV